MLRPLPADGQRPAHGQPRRQGVSDYFGKDRVTELVEPLPVSEDFGSFGTEWGVPSLFWYVGGTDPELYRRAEKSGRIAEDVPTNHSSKFAPVLHPTLETGIQTLTTASLSYLGARLRDPAGTAARERPRTSPARRRCQSADEALLGDGLDVLALCVANLVEPGTVHVDLHV